jgi:hypothetical protein
MKGYLITLMTFFVFFVNGYGQDTILMIVGKKISATTDRPPIPLKIDTLFNIPIDGKIIDTVLILELVDPINIAVYKVLKVIDGDFREDTIKFVYHNKSHIVSLNNVLLLLHKSHSSKYILKRQPVEIYKTKDNQWASPVGTYIAEIGKYPQPKPQKMRFDPKLVFDVGIYDKEYIKEHYPLPYYKIKKNKAFAVQGIYVEDLAILIK